MSLDCDLEDIDQLCTKDCFQRQPTKIPFEWKIIDHEDMGNVARAKVFGGWIVRSAISIDNSISISMTFIPDAFHKWSVMELPII